MRHLYKDERDFLNLLRLKGYRGKHAGYVVYIYKKKKYKRSRILFQIFHGVKLDKFDIIHHKDRNKENDHITNLQLITPEKHISMHHAGKRKANREAFF